MQDEEKARIDIVSICHRIYSKGWVANHDGNVSVRISDERIIATPTAVSKGDIRPEMLIVVDIDGNKVEGTRKSFSELSLHLACYKQRKDINSVVHAHPVTSSAFSVTGVEIDPTFMPEAVVSLGNRIPLTAFLLPYGQKGAEVLTPFIDEYDVFLLRNHGILSTGSDVFMAFYRLELAEHIAKIQHMARSIGKIDRLSDEDIEHLLLKRTQAGLGAKSRTQSNQTDNEHKHDRERDNTPTQMHSFCSGIMHDVDRYESNGLPNSFEKRSDLTSLIVEEIQKVITNRTE